MMELKAKHPKMEMRNPVKRVGIDQVQTDWLQEDETAVDYIKNKPIIPQPEPQIQADWNQEDETALDFIKNKPVEPEITTYDIQFEKVLMSYGKFNFVNTEDSHETIFEKLRNGTARINRIFDLTYDPIDTLPSALVAFPEYELDNMVETQTGYNMYFKRTMSFAPAQYTNPLIDALAIAFRKDTKTFSSIYHSYKQLTPSIIIYTDFEFADDPYPHAIKFSNAGGRWGKTNLIAVKNARAGFTSDFNYILRVTTHGDNVWLRPTETVSANALPRFIGESEKLRKRVVVTFDNWTDSDHPTATMDLQDLAEPQIQADWNQADTTALDYIKNKPTAVSAFTNDAGYLTAHQDISGKADKAELTAHTGNTTIHITANERTYWNGKVNSADLATVATSGSYNDLSNKPTIPTDAHINSLIDTKLGVVENGTY